MSWFLRPHTVEWKRGHITPISQPQALCTLRAWNDTQNSHGSTHTPTPSTCLPYVRERLTSIYGSVLSDHQLSEELVISKGFFTFIIPFGAIQRKTAVCRLHVYPDSHSSQKQMCTEGSPTLGTPGTVFSAVAPYQF